MIQRSSLASRICGTAALVLLTCCAARLHAAAPATTASRTDISAAACTPAEERGRTTEEQARRPAMQVRTTGEQRRTTEVQTRTAEAPLRTAPSDDRSKRARHLAPRGRSQHTFFANAGYTAILSTIYLRESSSGSLNEGLEITAGYNWTSRRGVGVGVVYSGAFISAQRGGFERTSRIHYIAPEFVARQRVGTQVALPRKRGYRLRPLHPQLRRPDWQQGRRRNSRVGIGRIHADALPRTGGHRRRAVADRRFARRGRRGRAELGRHLPGSAGRRNPVLFLMPAGRNNCRLFNVVSFRRKQNS